MKAKKKSMIEVITEQYNKDKEKIIEDFKKRGISTHGPEYDNEMTKLWLKYYKKYPDFYFLLRYL